MFAKISGSKKYMPLAEPIPRPQDRMADTPPGRVVQHGRLLIEPPGRRRVEDQADGHQEAGESQDVAAGLGGTRLAEPRYLHRWGPHVHQCILLDRPTNCSAQESAEP